MNIEALIPHRDPFLFVDRLEKADEKGTVGFKVFKDSEFFFRGHFPAYPVVPGVILIETMAQCGGAGVCAAGLIPPDSLFFLGTIEKAKFRSQVRPRDEVRMEVQNVKISQRVIKQKGKAFVGETLAAEAEWLCILGDSPEK